MAAGSRDHPPMLATGQYAQWRSRFLRYIDTRPNGDALQKCVLKGLYTPTIVTTPAAPAIEDSPAVPEQTTVETALPLLSESAWKEMHTDKAEPLENPIAISMSLTLVGTKGVVGSVLLIVTILETLLFKNLVFQALGGRGIKDSDSKSLDDSGVIDVSMGLRDSLTA
ncbi:hypothetical protein Tco_1320293 [Tanacetum coccineum]